MMQCLLHLYAYLKKDTQDLLLERKNLLVNSPPSITCKRAKTISRKASDFTELETVIKQENQDMDDDIFYRQQKHEMVANILEQTLEIATMDKILKTVIKEENVEEFHENHQNEMFAWDFKQTPEIPKKDSKKINFADELRMVIKKEKQEMDEVVNRNQPQVDVKKAKKAANPDTNVKIINRFNLQNYTNTIELRNKNINNQKNVLLNKDHFDCSGAKENNCELCEQIFSDKLSLQQHWLVHNNTRKKMCKGDLKIHLTSSTRHKGEKRSNAQYHKNTLKQHLIKHSRGKPFHCEICHKVFSWSSLLKKHIATHAGKKPFKSDMCQKDFLHKHSLKRHLTIHSGEKPFSCHLCQKDFPNIEYFKRHLAFHAGNKTFKCDMCQKHFLLIAGLKLHLLTHVGDRPFKCEMCRKCFLFKVQLKNHLIGHIRTKFTGQKKFKL